MFSILYFGCTYYTPSEYLLAFTIYLKWTERKAMPKFNWFVWYPFCTSYSEIHEINICRTLQPFTKGKMGNYNFLEPSIKHYPLILSALPHHSNTAFTKKSLSTSVKNEAQVPTFLRISNIREDIVQMAEWESEFKKQVHLKIIKL